MIVTPEKNPKEVCPGAPVKKRCLESKIPDFCENLRKKFDDVARDKEWVTFPFPSFEEKDTDEDFVLIGYENNSSLFGTEEPGKSSQKKNN